MKVFRLWRGWTSLANADAYEQLLKREILPGIHRIDGYCGAHLLRRIDPRNDEEVEFMTITTWDSWDAIHRFSSDGRTGAVVPEAARRLLAHFDEHSKHFEATWVP